MPQLPEHNSCYPKTSVTKFPGRRSRRPASSNSSKIERTVLERDQGAGTVDLALLEDSAGVLLRRLMALAIAGKAGGSNKAWKMASRLEELPGEGMLAALPDTLVKSLKERMALELKLEQMSRDGKAAK